MKPALEKRAVTLASCLFEDEDEFLRGWREVVVPTLRAYPRWTFEVRVLDNSRRPLERARREVLDVPGGRYQWWGGRNLRFSRSVNRMVDEAAHPRFVYLCPAHCHMSSAQWLEDLLTSLEEVPFGIAGHRTEGPRALPFEHIQGGVFAGRTEDLRRLPFPEDLPHDFSDVVYSRLVEQRGGALVNVASVVSRGGLGIFRRQLLMGQLRRGRIHLLHLGRVRNSRERHQGRQELSQWGANNENRRILLGSS